jgi:hypothetical protein
MRVIVLARFDAFVQVEDLLDGDCDSAYVSSAGK